jgi:hypothetical protein
VSDSYWNQCPVSSEYAIFASSVLLACFLGSFDETLAGAVFLGGFFGGAIVASKVVAKKKVALA